MTNNNTKFELLADTMTLFEIDGLERKMYRIRALRAIPENDVFEGEIGGWVEHESNLSKHQGSWIRGEAKVCGNSMVRDDAIVMDNAQVFGNSYILGNCRVSGNAEVIDSTIGGTSSLFENTSLEESELSGNILMYGESTVTRSRIDGKNISIKERASIEGSQLFVEDFIVSDYATIEHANIGKISEKAKKITVLDFAKMRFVSGEERPLSSVVISGRAILENLVLEGENIIITGQASISGLLRLYSSQITDFVSIQLKSKTLLLKASYLSGDIEIDDTNVSIIEENIKVSKMF